MKEPLNNMWYEDVKEYSEIITSTLPSYHNLDNDDINLIADILVRANRQKLKKRLEKLNFSQEIIELQLERKSD